MELTSLDDILIGSIVIPLVIAIIEIVTKGSLKSSIFISEKGTKKSLRSTIAIAGKAVKVFLKSAVPIFITYLVILVLIWVFALCFGIESSILNPKTPTPEVQTPSETGSSTQNAVTPDLPKENLESGGSESSGEIFDDPCVEDSFSTPVDTEFVQEQTTPITMSLFTGDRSKLNKLFFINASASSELVDDEYGSFPAVLAIDGRTDTSWQEGVIGYGIDESITVYFADSTKVSVIEVFPGFAKSEYTFFANGRPSRLRFDFSDGTSCTYDFEDTPGGVAIALSEPVITDYICITILNTYSAEWQDTAISEIRAYN